MGQLHRQRHDLLSLVQHPPAIMKPCVQGDRQACVKGPQMVRQHAQTLRHSVSVPTTVIAVNCSSSCGDVCIGLLIAALAFGWTRFSDSRNKGRQTHCLCAHSQTSCCKHTHTEICQDCCSSSSMQKQCGNCPSDDRLHTALLCPRQMKHCNT